MNEEERAQQQLIHHCQMAECRSGSESALKSYFQSNEYEIASKTPFCHSMLAWNNCELRNALFFLSILSYFHLIWSIQKYFKYNSFESNISWNHEIIYNIPFFVCINDCRKRIKTSLILSIIIIIMTPTITIAAHSRRKITWV